MGEIPRTGSVGYYDEDGSLHYAAPGDKLFSVTTMLATHWFNGTEWVKIFEDDDDVQH